MATPEGEIENESAPMVTVSVGGATPYEDTVAMLEALLPTS